MEIYTPSIPKHLTVTDQMLEDFLWDPVLAARVILGLKFDAFQACRLRVYWLVPKKIDSSGFSSGKTIVDWAYIQLRCILMGEHDAGVYYPTFETGKNTFWQYYTKCDSKIFQAHLGRLDEKGEEEGTSKLQGAACFKAFYRNGSKMFMPAPSFLKHAATQASMRFNTLLVEEWTHVDAMSRGIDEQLIGRVTKPCFNKNHPVRGNHLTFTAPAKTQMHPAYPRYRGYEKKVKRGDPNYDTITFSYKDYSNLKCETGKEYRDEYRIDSTIDDMKEKRSRSEFLGEGLGIWNRNAKGWFSEDAILACVELGRTRNLVPMVSKTMDEQGVKRLGWPGEVENN